MASSKQATHTAGPVAVPWNGCRALVLFSPTNQLEKQTNKERKETDKYE